jgi:hypothetical protein
MQGQTESAKADDRADCEQFHRMESRRTPSTQQDLMDQNMKRMSPEMRERHMTMMREKCGRRGSSSPTESKY